jgi:signal transduction histidine kinase
MTRFPTLFLLLLLWLFQPLSLPAQHNNVINHYTNENGLPGNGIKNFELDKKNGFLWIGTNGGLVRFDGKHFTSFAVGKDGLTNSRIALIAKNREGTIFFGDNNFLVSKINGARPAFVFTDTFFISPFRSKDGAYSRRTPEEVAAKLRTLKPSDFLPPSVIFRDMPGDSSSFSFSHFGNSYHYQAAQNRLQEFPGYFAMARVNKGTYFVHKIFDMIWYNDSLGKGIAVRLHGAPPGNDWKHKGPSLLWTPGMEAPLLTDQTNVWKLTGKNDSLHVELVCRDCCPPNSQIGIAQLWEEQGLLFLGSETNGLYVIKTPYIRTIRAEPGIEAGKEEYAQVEIMPGKVTTASGLSFTPQGALITTPPPFQFPHSNVFRDGLGDSWYSIADTIVHYDHRNGRSIKIPTNTGVHKMVFAEMSGRLYVITDLLIAEITGNELKVIYKVPNDVNNIRGFLAPDAAVEWKPGVLAIAGEKLLLFSLNKPAGLDTIAIPGLSAKTRGLLKYGDYRFIGTYGQGFYVYKEGKVKKMPLDKNGYLAYAHCFMMDDKGYCWISTNHGLFKASLQALTTAWEKDLPEIYYQYFGKEDGIFNTEFNGGCQPCAIKLSTGQLSFPSMNGVAFLDPLRPHSTPPAGPIFIDEVWVDSTLHEPNDGYLQELPYDARNLRFKLTLPYFGNLENIYFSYKLEPYNSAWETQDIIQNNTLQFGGLKPGHYTLYLRVRNGFEPDQFAMTEISFRLLKPWFQLWWFYLLCALGFLALIAGLVMWRTARIAKRREELQELVTIQTQHLAQQSEQLETQLKQLQNQQVRLEEDNNIKARLIGIISHDMISPLKFMGYMSKRLREAFLESDPSYHTATFIANVAQELESLSVNILNWIKFHHQSVKMTPEQFDLKALVTETVEIPATLAKEKGLHFQMDIPAQTQVVQYRQAIGVIIYNLSMNAMKYTAKGSIRIWVGSTDEWIMLTVTDTGTGMPPDLVMKLNSMESFVAGYSMSETSKYQFGYVIIKDLLRLVDGSMIVESVENKGTTVTLQWRRMAEGG